MTTADDDTRDRLGVMPLRCPDNAATHYAGCPCNEATWQERLAETEAKLARAEAALREIADDCDCDFPQCQSNIARAALAEAGR